jgi:hypothetical protein
MSLNLGEAQSGVFVYHTAVLIERLQPSGPRSVSASCAWADRAPASRGRTQLNSQTPRFVADLFVQQV